VLLLAVGLLCLVVGFIVFGILGAGLLPAIGLSVSIIGSGSAGFAPMVGMMEGGGYAGGFGGGHMIAAAIGGGLLWAIAATLVGQVYLLGLSIVYLRVTEGLDVGAAQAALQRGLDDAKRRTAEIGERARAAAQRVTTTAEPRAGSFDSSSATPTDPAAAAPFARPQSPSTTATSTADGSRPESAAPVPAVATPAPASPISTGASVRGPDSSTQPHGTAPVSASSAHPHAATPASASSVSPDAGTSVPATPPIGVAAATIPCPKCAAPCSADDLFCGTCGQRLR